MANSTSSPGTKPPPPAAKPAGPPAKPAAPAAKTPARSPAVAAKTASKSHQDAIAHRSKVSSSQPAGAPTASCPRARKPIKVCDLTTAKLTDAGAKTPREVTAKGGQKFPLPPKLPVDKKRIAGGYDLVLETVSDIRVEGKSAAGAKFACVVPAAEYIGGCADHATLCVCFHPKNPDLGDPIVDAATFHNVSFNGTVPAKTWITDKRNLGSGDFLAFFTRDEDQVKQVEVTFLSCGTPKPPQTEKIGSLRGLVRVYRNETIDFSLSFPPLYDKTYYKKTKDATGTTITKTNSGTPQYTDTVKRDPSGKVISESTVHKQGWVNQTTQSSSYDRATGAVTTKEPEKKLKIGLSIKRNGEELTATKAINQWIEGYFKFSKDLFTALSDFQKMIPKVGFSFSCDITLVEGQLTGALGVRPEPGWDTDSHKWVTNYGKIGVDLKLLGIDLKFGFGVEASTPGIVDWLFSNGEKAFELFVGIKATLTLEMRLKGDATIFGPTENKSGEWTVMSAPGSAKLEVYVQAKVTWNGQTCDAKAGLEAGLKAGAEIKMNPFDIRASCQLTRGVVYAYFNYPGKKQPSPRWEYEIWSDGTEHAVKLLHG